MGAEDRDTGRMVRSRYSGQVGVTRFRHGAASITGRVRLVNEDSYLAEPPLFAVADGMGGHGAGDIASALAIDALTACARRSPLTIDAVLAALDDASHAISDRGEPDGSGTTVTGIAAVDSGGSDHLMVFNVGDSRTYRIVGDRLDQVTVDHSEIQELLLGGVITQEQARVHPRRNIVTRALGSDPIPVADRWLVPAVAGDRYLLCSDGLVNELPGERILDLLAIADPQAAASALVAEADKAGGRDNITAVVIDVEAEDDAADDAITVPRPRPSGQS